MTDQTIPALPEGWRLADHKDYGRVLVTNTTPNLFGRVYIVVPTTGPLGSDWRFCTPDELTYLDASAPVPPNTLAVGSKWNDAAALTRACDESNRDQIIALDSTGDAFVWSYDAEWWEGSVSPLYAPYTIIHTGREAGQ